MYFTFKPRKTKLMKKGFLFLILLTFSSCYILFPKYFVRNIANYNLENLWFNTKLDKNKDVSYLLNTTQLNYKSSYIDTYNEQLIEFFSNELGNNTVLKANYKDGDGKIKIPFTLEFDLTDSNIELLQKTTNLDYVILSKILNPSQINNLAYPQYKDLRFNEDLLGGSVVFFKIFDIKNNKIFLDMRCKSSVYDLDDFNFDTKSYEEDTRINSYKNEDKLIKKCFKKIFNKIN